MATFVDTATFAIAQTADIATRECFTTPKRIVSGLGADWWLECYPKGKNEKDLAFRVLMRVSEGPVSAVVEYYVEGTDLKGSSELIFQKSKAVGVVAQLNPTKVPPTARFTCRARFKAGVVDVEAEPGDVPPAIEAISIETPSTNNPPPRLGSPSSTSGSSVVMSPVKSQLAPTAKPAVKKESKKAVLPPPKFPSKSNQPATVTDTASITLNRSNFNNTAHCISTPKRFINMKEPMSWWLDVYPCGNNPTVSGLVLIFLRVSNVPVDVVVKYSVDNTDITVTSKHRYTRSDALGCQFGQSHQQFIQAGVFGLDSFSITCCATFMIPSSPTAPFLGPMSTTVIPKKKKIRFGAVDYSKYTPNDLILDSPDYLVGIPIKTEILKNATVGEVYKTREYIFPGGFDHSYQLYCYPGGDQDSSSRHVSVFAEFRTISFLPFVVTGKWGLAINGYEKTFEYPFEFDYGWGGFTKFASHERLFQRGTLNDGGVTITFSATVTPQEPFVPFLPPNIWRTPLDGALVVGVERVPVQTKLLSFISPVFKQRFIERPYDTDITLLEFDANLIRIILKFVQNKEPIEVTMPLACHMLKFAAKFQINALREYAEKFLISKLAVENFFALADVAWAAPSETLQMACGRFLNGYMSMIVNDSQFVKLDAEVLKDLFIMAQKHPRWQMSHSSGLKLRFWVVRPETEEKEPK
uniref:BTB domain-containing protein n=1 Tax=Panagrellus redivivus TaxID=6233 RepID=A0A7E4WAL3_PANRE